jgi:hypothetical protein
METARTCLTSFGDAILKYKQSRPSLILPCRALAAGQHEMVILLTRDTPHWVVRNDERSYRCGRNPGGTPVVMYRGMCVRMIERSTRFPGHEATRGVMSQSRN